jgi:hypothetical protein
MSFELDKVGKGGGQICGGHESIITDASGGSGLGGSGGVLGGTLGT